MSRISLRLAIAAAVLLSAVSVRAQDYVPRISSTLKTSNEAIADLEWVLNLTSPEERKQWPTLKDYLDIFLIGVDPARPLRSDVIMGAKVDRYIMSIPIADFREFRNGAPETTRRPRFVLPPLPPKTSDAREKSLASVG